jgi:hypothetical protein
VAGDCARSAGDPDFPRGLAKGRLRRFRKRSGVLPVGDWLFAAGDESREMPAPARPRSDGGPRSRAARSHGERHSTTGDCEETLHDASIEMLV